MTRTQHHARRWLLPVAIWAAGTASVAHAQGNHAAAIGLVPHNEQGHAADPTGVSGGVSVRTGRSMVVPVCYANCDQSTTAPVLNVNDFACFLNRFAAGDAYANCDGSTTPPTLNVLDFSCFLNAFAAGCS